VAANEQRLISGRVIRIVSNKQLILNVGSEHGVLRGQRFQIFAPADPIVDPETGEHLGVYRLSKAFVEPDQIFDKFTIASQPYDYNQDPDYPEEDAIWPDLPINPEDIEPLAARGRVVVGDSAEQVPPTPPVEFVGADEDIPF
jgi:hypothetical protein